MERAAKDTKKGRDRQEADAGPDGNDQGNNHKRKRKMTNEQKIQEIDRRIECVINKQKERIADYNRQIAEDTAPSSTGMPATCTRLR